MGKLSFDDLYKYRILMFVFKNKELFYAHTSGSNSRFGGGLVAEYPG